MRLKKKRRPHKRSELFKCVKVKINSSVERREASRDFIAPIFVVSRERIFFVIVYTSGCVSEPVGRGSPSAFRPCITIVRTKI